MACPYLLSIVTGIRSQSKPNDIMGEVYRAMVSLGYVSKLENFISFLANCRHNQFFSLLLQEWKIINPFSLRVLHRNRITGKFVSTFTLLGLEVSWALTDFL